MNKSLKHLSIFIVLLFGICISGLAVAETPKQRLEQFMNANHVNKFIAVTELTANPFAHEGKIVALNVKFYSMLTRDSALFGYGSYLFKVSAIPPAVFNEERWVVIAGKVSGNKTEVTVPMMGKIEVPNLTYVKSYFCATSDCPS